MNRYCCSALWTYRSARRPTLRAVANGAWSSRTARANFDFGLPVHNRTTDINSAKASPGKGDASFGGFIQIVANVVHPKSGRGRPGA
jgi:hypothetical protein